MSLPSALRTIGPPPSLGIETSVLSVAVSWTAISGGTLTVGVALETAYAISLPSLLSGLTMPRWMAFSPASALTTSGDNCSWLGDPAPTLHTEHLSPSQTASRLFATNRASRGIFDTSLP